MTDRAVPDWLTRHTYAHRGLHRSGIPENSLAGAEAAIAAGMGIECDIQRSFDDVPMVFHDWDLDRLTGVAGETDREFAEDLEQLRLLGTDQKPVRFSTFLEFIGGRVPLLIEIKSFPDYNVDETTAAVIAELESYSGGYAVMSFDPRVAAWVREHAPETCCGLVMREDEHGYTQTQADRERAFEQAQPDFLAYHIAALPNPWVAGLRKMGLPILTWTVNSPETRARALQNADALIAEGEGIE
ncbi:MAG: glycerophosphodiester phosphodiesterase family protein [Pseudomonadota bacterium]